MPEPDGLAITTLEAFRATLRGCANASWDVEGEIADAEAARAAVPFLHRVVTEGAYPPMDVAARWCWRRFGPYRGECRETYSHYPACPLVLDARRLEQVEAGPRSSQRSATGTEAPEHSHVGSWALVWFAKTQYDHGFMEWCFASEDQLAAFLTVVETLGWGEEFQAGS